MESARQLKKEEVAEDDEGTLVYLPTAAREMLRQEFDLRSRDSVFTQVVFSNVSDISLSVKYGVLEHLLLEPLHHTIDGQDEWRDIQSAFNVALLNSGWYVIYLSRLRLILARFLCLFDSEMRNDIFLTVP